MLRLENIIKNYETGKTSFPALKGISLAFRKNEFVSILGPSGCGKTTLLNIIGGLDHYTSGDLVIEGKSTKEYKSSDWDLYRNHRIGFIFQSYNLIPHQNILENVELALTIAGYSKEEKRKKAMKALAKVGLKSAWKKMPNQLSGGQCQRVAIARALVNEPDILLGDEPTGALDSKTSVQVMELIRSISKKKLVIMVTHNPPLAEKYSTRIISLLDGEVQSDTNPYKLTDEKKEVHKKIDTIKVGSKTVVKADKAKMSFWSAFKLSAKNLISKKKRTAMVIAASSIGIVGVSAVLAVSAGVRGYISRMENDMLSGNPVTASETTLDLASIASRLSSLFKKDTISQSWKGNYIDIEFITKKLIEAGQGETLIRNDVNDYYVEYLNEINEKSRRDLISEVSLDYGMDFSNNIYTVASVVETEDDKDYYAEGSTAYSLSGLKNIYTTILATLNDGKGTDYTPLSNIAANFPSVFYQGLDNQDYIKSQYNIARGRLADKDATDECVVVLNKRNRFPDLLVTLAGMYSERDFINAINEFVKGKDLDPSKIISKIDYDKIMNQKIFYVPSGGEGDENEGAYHETKDSSAEPKYDFIDRYNYRFKYDNENKQLKRKAPDGGKELVLDIKEGGVKPIKIVGVITPKEGKNYGSLPSGIYFTSGLANKVIDDCRKGNLMNVMRFNNNKEITNLAFIPNKIEEETHEPYKIGLTYELNVIKFDQDGKPIYKDPVNTYGTVGSGALILTNQNDPAEKDPSKAVKGTIITSKINTREIAGLKAVEVKSENAVTYNYEPKVYRASIYIDDFPKKEQVLSYLDKWNGDEKITIKDPYDKTKTIELGGIKDKDSRRSTVTYNDNLTVVISMINNLINITTISLTIFASLALVVSSVMIGIITYISVMERIKEIGVIRSLGGRKKDVSHLFNAETFILGGAAGLFGVLITYVFELILDVTIYATYKIPMIANLKWWVALLMILLSIVLTAVSGLIPAKSAAKKDPVTALRSE